MAKIIKNKSGAPKNYAGQLVADQGVYQIQIGELLAFQKSDLLLNDIILGDSVIYSDTDSNELDGSIGIMFLMDYSDDVHIQSAFASKFLNGESLFKRNHGMGEITLDAGEVGDLEFQIGYGHVKMEALEIMDQIDTIKVELFIEDDDDGNYSQTGNPRQPLNQFGFEFNIPKCFYRSASKYDADLYYGMWVVVQITNTSNIVQTIRANIELNEVR